MRDAYQYRLGAFIMPLRLLTLSWSTAGIGIPADKQGVVFMPFEQVDSPTTRLHGGTGLGLALAKILVEAHGGTVTVRSELGKGSTFTILIPLKATKETEEADISRLLNNYPEQSANKPDDKSLMPASRAEMVSEESSQPLKMELPRSVMMEKSKHGIRARGFPASGGQYVEVKRPARRTSSLRAVLKQVSEGQKTRDSIVVDWLKSRKEEALACMIRTELQDRQSMLEVLVVDDEPINQAMMAELLSSSGFQVTSALSGKEALDMLLRRYEESGTRNFPSLILMDLTMPEMNGHETTAKIRALYTDCPMPIIMLSTNADEDSITTALEYGCTDYITMPFKSAELLARVGLQLDVIHQDTIQLEARRHEELLLELLPSSVIERLKKGYEVFDQLTDVTVLYVDIPNISETIQAFDKAGILAVDALMKRMDSVLDLHGMYKVHSTGESKPIQYLRLG